MPATLDNKSGRRPTLSRKNVATRMNMVFTNPTAMVASSFGVSLTIPAFSKIFGLYNTTASIPLACWKKWIPTAAIKMWRTVGVGWTSNSLHIPSPWLRFGTWTTSSLQSSGMPAASLMSASRSLDSSKESEVLSSTILASPSRPCVTSQRGDSGMPSTPKARNIEGTAPIPNINRHPNINRRYHKGVSNADTGDKPTDHEKRIVSSESHQDCSDEEDSSGKDDGVPTTNPVGSFSGGGRADQGVEVQNTDEDLDLSIATIQIPLDVDLHPTHHTNVCHKIITVLFVERRIATRKFPYVATSVSYSEL
ncbi:hypothetical protein Ccrd_004710 [Cynara cardunculus var. scolymus]|uniref:Uncharacterized protein n=1 Tax=Cynara cardunculus var. scolymus TaxID=59895 RepID=A0A124SCB1_CYNCS|nr:hypothetical protein Ccrd_004710 [Cynara cardunculus var. scolymus]